MNSSTQKSSVYDANAADTSFRKSYDLSAYASRFAQREAAEKQERRARYEAKLLGQKYHAPPSSSGTTESLTSARSTHLSKDASSLVGTHTLVPLGSAVGKRGRGAGFYCDKCDLTFKDNKQWIEHVNSKQHLQATGQTAHVKRATADEVHARIIEEWEKIQDRKRDAAEQLDERLKRRRADEEREREERKTKRKEKKEARRREEEERVKKMTHHGDDVRNLAEHDEDDMMAAMGFTGFGTSKK